VTCATIGFLSVDVGRAGSSLARQARVDASLRKARLTTGPSNRSGKEDQPMVQMLVVFSLPIVGRVTVLIHWPRKRKR
jgi:hypothetical protein